MSSPLTSIDGASFDVAIVGGGINGACLYHALTAAGYRVLLADRGDFGGGTSQASTMLIWGGLLYMKDWELRTVWSLCGSRDRLIQQQPAQLHPRTIRYVPVPGGRSRALVQSAMIAYWLIGLARRRRPYFERQFAERAMLNHGGVPGALSYEEAALEASDARFVLSWILNGGNTGSAALNYCAVRSAAFDRSQKAWRIDVSDTLASSEAHVHARVIVNAAGGWTDAINAAAGIESPYRHVLSRGVSLSLPRDPRHTTHLILETSESRDAMTYAPWGPVSLWGSTDTVHPDIDTARRVDAEDIATLLRQLNEHLSTPVWPADVISVRCGVRPVAVRRGAQVDGHSNNLSRHHRVHADTERPWVSVYGGKLSGCTTLAAEVSERVAGLIGPRVHAVEPSAAPTTAAPAATFPGIAQPMTAPAWSAAHERCRTLDDYLRRRTNIAQWVKRGGLGQHHEHLGTLQHIATAIHGGDTARAAADLSRYRERADREWQVLEGVTL